MMHLNTSSELWIDALWRASWQGGIALALVWCICRFVPRISPAFKVWLWRLACLKLLVALFWSATIDLPLLARPAEVATTPEPTGAHSAVPLVPVEMMNIPDKVDQPSFAATDVLLVIWMVGVLAGAVRLAHQWRHSALLRRDSSLISDGALQELCVAFRIRRVPELRQSHAIRAPVLVGMFKPRVIVPNNAKGAALTMMLAHELAHLKRRDLLWGWLPAVCHTLFFFHPLLWLSRREGLLAQETACDEFALRYSGAAPAAYGNMLVDLLGVRVPTPQFGTLGICENIQNVKRRILSMKMINERKSRGLTIALLIVIVAGLLPWRIVAQDTPEDAAKRIQQLEKENANLRAELNKARQTPQATAEGLRTQESSRIPHHLATAIIAAEVELAAIRSQYADRHPKVAEAETRLKKLKQLQAEEKSRASVTREKTTRERELYMEELALAQNYADSIQKQVQIGRATQEDVVRSQRQVFGIQREIAKLDADRARLKEVVEEEMHAVQQLLKEAKKQVEVGRAPLGHDLDLQREMLKLKREWLTLEEP